MSSKPNFYPNAKLDLVRPGAGRPMNIRRLLVVHYTEGVTAASSIDFWKNDPNCKRDDIGAHFIIERTGEIYQCRPLDRTISHCGNSRWYDPYSKIMRRGCNAFAIGIELANTGSATDKITAEDRLPAYSGTVRKKHKLDSTFANWEVYPTPQLTSLETLSDWLFSTFHLDDVVGHDNIAPERKRDPGPAFDLAKLRRRYNLPPSCPYWFPTRTVA